MAYPEFPEKIEPRLKLVPIHDSKKIMGIYVSVRFINEAFFRWARPHKGLHGSRGSATSRMETRGERSTSEKGPFMDGHYLI